MLRETLSAWRPPLLLLAASFVATAWLALHPKPGQPVAAVFPPWWGGLQAFEAVASAGGELLRTGAWPAIVVTISREPGLASRLHATGAWLVLDARALGTCAPRS